MKVIPPCGPTPNNVLLVGEAPGQVENYRNRPFVGPAGNEQERYLNLDGETAEYWRLTNVVYEYIYGNPDPTPARVKHWTPVLLREVETTRPKVIIAVGKSAAAWFLGDKVDMFTVHGLPHKAGDFDKSKKLRGGPRDAVVIPIFHPAGGFHSDKMRAIIWWDYQQVAKILKQVRAGNVVWLKDEYPDPTYLDVTGSELCSLIDSYGNNIEKVAIDTEDDIDKPWSIQVCLEPGVAFVLRYIDSEFALGIQGLQQLADKGVKFIAHQWMHDLSVCRAMGLNLSRATLKDTMYSLYALRTERMGLKRGVYRWCGIKNAKDYLDVIGPIAKDKQELYLQRVVLGKWPRIEPYYTHENDGTVKKNSPWQVSRRADAILNDSLSGKVNKAGELVDVQARWGNLLPQARLVVETKLGPLPIGTLADIPLDEAVDYAGGDADKTFRLDTALKPELKRLGVETVVNSGMNVLAMFEAMQATGLPFSKSRFQALQRKMTNRMTIIQARISHLYNNDRPINPGSSDQVAVLMNKYGLKGTKKSKVTGKPSMGKDSIAHLRYVEPMITDVFEWKECAHTRDFDCAQALSKVVGDDDLQYVKAQLKPMGTVARRLAAEDPNVLAITKHGDFGKLIRRCYTCPPGKVFFEMDLSQIEIAVAASVSGDEIMCEAIRNGVDMHTKTATLVFDLPMDKIDKNIHRLPAKTTFFGGMYGQGAAALYNEFLMLGLKGWSVKKCADFQKKLEVDSYPQLTQAKLDLKAEVAKTGIVRSASGMVRHLPGIWSDDDGVKEEAGRHSWSHKIQGTAQDMLQNSMAWLWPRILELQSKGVGVQPCLQIHDSLMFIIDDDEETKKIVYDLVHEGLTKHYGVDMKVPIRAEGGSGKTWADLD